VLVGGSDIADSPRAARAMTGLLLSDERALYWRLTGRDNLRFFGVMAGLPRRAAERRADELLEDFGLAHRDRRVFGYSSGMRVRLGLARALIARPKLLILDEPSRSLDPVASGELLGRLRDLATQGRSVLFASHRLDEVEAICDRVLVLIDGEQRAWGAAADLRHDTGSVAAALRELLHAQDAP
jgi:ABC-2 type transport system ATP-binding protein